MFMMPTAEHPARSTWTDIFMQENLRQQDHLKKALDIDLPRDTKRSPEYRMWWRVQVTSLFFFVVLLMLGIVGDWWLLFPGFLCLALNMFANINRMRMLTRDKEANDRSI